LGLVPRGGTNFLDVDDGDAGDASWRCAVPGATLDGRQKARDARWVPANIMPWQHIQGRKVDVAAG